MSERTTSNSTVDKVVFHSVPGAYKPGENVIVQYQFKDSKLETHSRDWIGLFCVGWTSNRDYYTFEWAPKKKEKEAGADDTQVVKFSGSRLPPYNYHFYQFYYVSYSGVVRGASRPFQFTKSSTNTYFDDLEVVEDEEDSLLLLRTKHDAEVAELQKKVEDLALTHANMEASFVQVKSNRDDLQTKLDEIKALLDASQLEVSQLKDTVEAKEDQAQRVKEVLEDTEKQFEVSQKEVALLQMTIVAKEEEIQEGQKSKKNLIQELDEATNHIQILQKELGSKDKELQNRQQELQMDLAREKKEMQEAETQLRMKCNQLEEHVRKLEEEKSVLTGRSEYYEANAESLKEKLEVMEAQHIALEAEMNGLAEEIEKQKHENHTLNAKLHAKDQEVNVVQQNLCEVLGNIKEPKDILEQQPHENIDKSALEALQLAYSDVEKRWNFERKAASRMKNRVAEMEERIKRCQQEYEVIANETVELKKQLKKQGVYPIAPEENKEQVIVLKKQLESLELELQHFQLKHDERISEKNVAIEQLKEALDDMTTQANGLRQQETAMKTNLESLNFQNNQLNVTIRDLQRELEKRSHKPRDQLVTPTIYPNYSRSRPVQLPPPHVPRPPRHEQNRECPVCQTIFPSRMSQDEIVRHVNNHF